jgi:hypothetical protein
MTANERLTKGAARLMSDLVHSDLSHRATKIRCKPRLGGVFFHRVIRRWKLFTQHRSIVVVEMLQLWHSTSPWPGAMSAFLVGLAAGEISRAFHGDSGNEPV